MHPADSSLYFEVPDVPALTQAYSAAPLMQLLSDPVWNGFAARALDEDPESFKLDAWCFEYFDESLDEIANLAGADIDLRGACEGLRAFSFSLSAPDLAAALEASMPGTAAAAEDSTNELGAVLILDYASAESAQRGIDFCVGALQLIPEAVQHKQAPLTLLGQEGLAQHYRHTNPGPLPAIWSATCGSSVIIGVGKETPETWRALADSKTAQLAGNATFAGGAPSRHFEGAVNLYDGFLDVRGMTAALDTLRQHEKLTAFVGMAQSITTLLPGDVYTTRRQTYLAGDRFLHESVTSPLTLLAGIGVAPVTRRAVEYLPPGTLGASATTVRAEDFEPLLMELVAEWIESDVTEARRFLTEVVGLDPRADLLEPLGSAAACYVMPFAGPTVPEFGAIIELEDRERLQSAMDKLFAAVEERWGKELDMRDGKYRGQAVYSILSKTTAAAWGLPDLGPANMIVDALRPGVSIALMEDRVLVSMERRFVTREVKRVLSPEEGAPVHPLAAEDAAYPEDATCVALIDWGAGLASLYEMGRTFASMVGTAGLPFDPSSLPPTEQLTRHFRPSLAWTTAVEHGSRTYAESSFGPESTLLVSALIGLFAYESTNTAAFIDRPVTKPAEPVPPVEPDAGDR